MSGGQRHIRTPLARAASLFFFFPWSAVHSSSPQRALEKGFEQRIGVAEAPWPASTCGCLGLVYKMRPTKLLQMQALKNWEPSQRPCKTLKLGNLGAGFGLETLRKGSPSCSCRGHVTKPGLAGEDAWEALGGLSQRRWRLKARQALGCSILGGPARPPGPKGVLPHLGAWTVRTGSEIPMVSGLGLLC